MKRLWPILALCVLLPATARAEPISISVESSSGGFSGGDSATTGWFSIDLGTVVMPAAGTVGTFLIDGLKAGSDYTVSLVISGISGWDNLRAEILDPLDNDDRMDRPDQPSYVPAGFSTSNELDGFSFAQGSGLERSAAFAGGAASIVADEMTNRGDVLMFTGLGTDTARVTFGLRDRLGSRGFLVRFSTSGSDSSGTAMPEPASMVLIGTGLAGLAMRRRRAV
jgi:hypothetical protein